MAWKEDYTYSWRTKLSVATSHDYNFGPPNNNNIISHYMVLQTLVCMLHPVHQKNYSEHSGRALPFYHIANNFYTRLLPSLTPESRSFSRKHLPSVRLGNIQAWKLLAVQQNSNALLPPCPQQFWVQLGLQFGNGRTKSGGMPRWVVAVVREVFFLSCSWASQGIFWSGAESTMLD